MNKEIPVVKTEWLNLTGKWFFTLNCPHCEIHLDNDLLEVSIDDWVDMDLRTCTECGELMFLSF